MCVALWCKFSVSFECCIVAGLAVLFCVARRVLRKMKLQQENLILMKNNVII